MENKDNMARYISFGRRCGKTGLQFAWTLYEMQKAGLLTSKEAVEMQKDFEANT